MGPDQLRRDRHSLRTRAALEKTMYHLLSLLDHKVYSFSRLHKFLWDRYRGVRQDLNTQVGWPVPCSGSPLMLQTTNIDSHSTVHQRSTILMHVHGLRSGSCSDTLSMSRLMVSVHSSGCGVCAAP